MIKDVTLNGAKIPDVTKVLVSVDSPSGDRGIFYGHTNAVRLIIIRDASKNAIVDGFAMATNQDGRRNDLTSGTIEFLNDKAFGNATISIKKAFVSQWSLDNPRDDKQPIEETIELRVGSMEYKASGNGVTYTLDDF